MRRPSRYTCKGEDADQDLVVGDSRQQVSPHGHEARRNAETGASAHHDRRQPTQHTVVWSPSPKSGAEGPKPSSLAQHRIKEPCLHVTPLSALVAHLEI